MAKKRYVLLDTDYEILDNGEFSDLDEAQHVFEIDQGECDVMYVAVVVAEFVPPALGKWRKK